MNLSAEFNATTGFTSLGWHHITEKEKLKQFPLTHSTATSPVFEGGVEKRRFFRQTQNTEFIEVQGQP